VVLLGLALASTYLPRKHQFRLAWSIFREKSSVWMLGGTLINEAEVQRKLREFSQDATEIQIIAGDADFLNAGLPQFDEVMALGSKCRVLLGDPHKVSNTSLKRLVDAGVDIRVHPRDPMLLNVNLRGRLKRSAAGMAACLFDKDSGGYQVINFSNETLVQLIVKEYDAWFSRGGNPLIRHVIFDAAGVAFDGDIADFYRRVQQETSLDVHAKAEDYSLVDRELNLGNCDIVDVLERRSGARIAGPDVQLIRELWSTTWRLNAGMALLAEEIGRHGLTVSICSNCDVQNSDVYEVKGYFDPFDRVFLSHEMQLLKPDEDYFRHMLDELEAEPWQVLFVDDARRATNVARKMGFKVLSMPRVIAPEEKAVLVKRHLHRINIFV
jgi:FMN phosphatase YigB (HAD superfamily)